jgi:fatty-acyl-CoA synthase
MTPGSTDWLNARRLVRLAFRVRQDSEYLVSRGQRLTRRQVLANVEALAAGLQALGVRKGDRVATVLPACPEAVYALFLPLMLGTVHVPLNPLLGEDELGYVLADCEARAAITTRDWYGQDHPGMLARLLPRLPELGYAIVRDAKDGDGRTFWALEDVMAAGKPLHRARIAADDTALITYTSGTTGRPKGVVHTRSQNWGLLVRAAIGRLNLSPLRCLLLPFPPYHFAGQFGLIAALLAGGKVILMDRLDPEQMLEHIQAEKVSQIGGSPTMVHWLLRTPGQERYDLSSVQRVVLSSEPCPPELARALHERLGCPLENMYGTTESGLISWTGVEDPWERAATTVGRPVPGARVRIVNDERLLLLPGERGEIAVQTSQMMTGYYRDPQLTAQVLDAKGRFYTGDVGTVGEDGYLRLVDRKRDLIVRGGEKISPAEIERTLESHPLIRRAGVIGVPGQGTGEEIWAYVELQPGAALADRTVLEFCRGQIAPFKIPDEVRFVPRLPTTVTGKVQKFRLREMAQGFSPVRSGQLDQIGRISMEAEDRVEE